MMPGMLLCVLSLLLHLAVIVLVVWVVYLVVAKLLAVLGWAVDPRTWQLIGLILTLLVLIWLVQGLMSGGVCGVGLWRAMR